MHSHSGTVTNALTGNKQSELGATASYWSPTQHFMKATLAFSLQIKRLTPEEDACSHLGKTINQSYTKTPRKSLRHHQLQTFRLRHFTFQHISTCNKQICLSFGFSRETSWTYKFILPTLWNNKDTSSPTFTQWSCEWISSRHLSKADTYIKVEVHTGSTMGKWVSKRGKMWKRSHTTCKQLWQSDMTNSIHDLPQKWSTSVCSRIEDSSSTVDTIDVSLARLRKLLWLKTGELDRCFLGMSLTLPDCLFMLLRCFTMLENKAMRKQEEH